MPINNNSDLGVLNGYNQGTQYSKMHGPSENFGIFNGQFEQGPIGQDENEPPEGWIFLVGVDSGAQIFRATGGYAGNWCVCGGNSQATVRGSTLEAQKYLPVSTAENYYAQLAAHSDAGGLGRLTWRLRCYDANKAELASVTLHNAAPAAGWTLYWYLVGSMGTALTAGTYYVRVAIDLQSDATKSNAWVWVDDVKFQQTQHWLWPQ